MVTNVGATRIKAICPAQEYYAAYLSDKKNNIGYRIERIICWAVIEFDDEDAPDEVVGQIFNGDCLTEATAVDEEESFGEFVGYFSNLTEANGRIAELEFRRKEEPEEEDGEEGDEEEENGDEEEEYVDDEDGDEEEEGDEGEDDEEEDEEEEGEEEEDGE